MKWAKDAYIQAHFLQCKWKASYYFPQATGSCEWTNLGTNKKYFHEMLNLQIAWIFDARMSEIGNQYAQYGMMIPGEDELKKAAQNVLSNQEEARKLNDMIYDRKVMDYLKNTLKITDKEISHEDFVKKSAEAIQ